MAGQPLRAVFFVRIMKYTTLPVPLMSRLGLMFLTAATGLLIPHAGNAVEITGTSYIQTFNDIGTTATASLPAGWKMSPAGTASPTYLAAGNFAAVTQAASSGSPSAGGRYNWGNETGTGDRAIGFMTSGSYNRPNSIMVEFQNSTGTTLTSLTVAFDLERYRAHLNALTNKFYFSTDGVVWAAALDTVVWDTTSNAVYNFNPTGSNLQHRTVTIPGISIAPDATFYLRWDFDAASATNSQGVGLDEVNLTWTGGAAGQNNLYWDANGTVAGAGATPAGTWGTDAFWSTSVTGEVATTGWTASKEAIFAAGEDAVSAYTVTLNGVQSADKITFQEGTVTLAGSALLMTGSAPTFTVDAALAVVNTEIQGTGGLRKSGPGTVRVGGTNTFSGIVNLAAGTLEIASNAALGANDNDLILSGTLRVTAPIVLPIERAVSGAGTLSVESGDSLKIQGPVDMTSLILADAGTVEFENVTLASVGTLTVNLPTTMSGSLLTLSGINTANSTGTVSIGNNLVMGTTARTISMPSADATLSLGGTITLSNTLTKSGPGTLVLSGVNTALNRVSIGTQGSTPASGGRVVINNKNSLGQGQIAVPTFFNFGTIESTAALTGENAIGSGLSMGGRDANPVVLAGLDMTFAGASSFFTTGSTGDVRLNVLNHTTFTGALSSAVSSSALTGFAVGGNGKLTLSGLMNGFFTALKLKDSVTVELDTDNISAVSAAAAESITLNAGTALAIGKIGTTKLVTAVNGLNGAATSTLKFDVAGTERGTGYDALIMVKPSAGTAGPVVFAGKIDVDAVGEFVFALGQTFDLLDWDASVTPDFTGIDFTLLPSLPAGLSWKTSSFAVNGTVSVVTESGADFMISQQPQALAKMLGQEATFTVTVSGGAGPFTYQWYKGETPLGSPSANAFYTIPAVTSLDAGIYTVDVTNASGTVTSNAAVLTVIVPVQIETHPANRSIVAGGGTTFEVTVNAASSGPFTYDWRKGGTSLGAPSSPVLTLSNVPVSDNGSLYDVIVTGPGTGNSATSNAATLTVITPGPIKITGNQTYTENFDGMGTSNAAGYPNAWTAYKAAGTGALAVGAVVTGSTSPALTAGSGGGSAGTIYNFGGGTAPADRALGSVASAGFIGAYGVSLSNDTGVTLEAVNVKIGFRSEMWRSGANAGTEVWSFEWKLGGDITSNEGWTPATVFDMTELNPALLANESKDGNAEGNFLGLAPTAFEGLSGWQPGQVLHLRWRDTDNTGGDAGMAIDDFVFVTTDVPPPPVFRYWDANGAVAGAGGATPSGTWGSDSFWSASSAGEVATEAWTADADAVFSAGADALGAYTVTVSGTQSVGSLLFQEGHVTLSGGTVHFSDLVPAVDVQSLEATLSASVTSSTGLLKRGPGLLSLTGANTFTGNVVLSGGTLSVPSDTSLGNADNDIVLSGGTFKTGTAFTLGAGRTLTGSGAVSVAAATEMILAGSVETSALTLSDSGSLRLNGMVNSLGAVTFSAPSGVAGNELSLTSLSATHASGTTTVANAVNFGSANGSAVVATGSALELSGALSLTGGGSNRLIKTGGGTLVLSGINTGLNKVAIGNQAAVPTFGGTVKFTNKDAIGSSLLFFNYGTLDAVNDQTGSNALPIGLSIGGRSAAPVTLAGENMTFTGSHELFAATGTTGEIVLNVDNVTTFDGVITVPPLSVTGVAGLTVGGNGTLVLNSSVAGLTIPVTLKDGVSLELEGSYGSEFAAVAPTLSLGAGTRLAVGKTGGVAAQTLYAGLSAAAGSVVHLELGGPVRGGVEAGYDALILAKTSLEVQGVLIFAGEIQVGLLNDFVPSLGQVFDILDWDAATVPNFAGITFDLPLLPEGLAWNISNFTTNGTIAVIENGVEILDHPDAVQVNPGIQVTFSVVAEGPGILTYQWFKGPQAIDGATASTYIIPSAAESDEGSYTVVVTSGSLTKTSNPATLTVNTPVSNVVAKRTPATSPLYVGDSVKFEVTALGTGTLVYQWYKGTTLIEGATASSYTINVLALTDAAPDYHVMVSNGGPAVTSNNVPLTVAEAAVAIVAQPAPTELMLGVGQMMTLQLSATGKPPLKYQWKKDGKNVGGATASIYRVPAVTAVMGGVYTCEVSNALNKVTSESASVGVIQTAPVILNLAEASSTTMKVTVSGPVTFDWKKNGADFLPATGFALSADKKTLTVKPLAIEHSGTYTILATLGSLPPFTGGTHIVKVFNAVPSSPLTAVMPDGVLGGAYMYDMPITLAEPPNNAPSAYAAKGLPAGLKMDPKTGVISGRPTKAGDFSVIMTASNKIGKSTTTGSLHIDDFPAKLAGVYAAMIAPNAGLSGNLGGRLDLTVTATGTYSGSVTLATVKYAVKGSVDLDADGVEDPSITLQIPRKGNPVPLPLVLEVDLPLNDATPVENKDRLVEGSIEDDVDTAAITGWRYKWDAKKGPAATDYLNTYTFGMALPDGDPLIGDDTVPQGSGYGSFKVTPDGKLKIAGKTADGETLTCASFVGPDGEVLIFQTLYTPVKGSLIGVPKITLAATNKDNTFAGALSWIRPSNTTKTARTYKDGFGPVSIAVSGGRYDVPDAGMVAFNVSAGTSLDLFFSEGGINLDAPNRADLRVSIGDKNKITPISVTNPSLTTLKSVVPATGAFTGSFTLVDNNLIAASPATLKRTVTFQGLIVKEGSGYVGVGYFLLPLRPSPTPPATTATTSPILSGHLSILPVITPP